MRNKYTKTGYSIEVNLTGKNYIVRANILRIKDNNYDVTLELRNKEIGKWDMLDEEHYSLTSENINFDVYDFIKEKYYTGYFDRFIERYEYELKCFDMGNDYMEMKRLGDK